MAHSQAVEELAATWTNNMNIHCPHCGETVVATPQTEKQAEVLAYIVDFQQRRGYRPTVRQIAQRLGVTHATIQARIESLRRQGLLDQIPIENRIDNLIYEVSENLNL